jgi:Sulfotransferase family
MAAQSDRPILVVGCPRSGTTMLQLMLHSHPRIAIPSETRFVVTAYERRRAFGDLRRPANRRALARWIVGRAQTKFLDLGLDPESITEEIIAGPPTLGTGLGIVFQAYARRFGKPRWGDKRPTYLQHLDGLLRLFPDAQVVHLIRDGRDCVASLKEMPWYKRDVFHAAATWTQAIDLGRRAEARLGPDSYYQLHYEHLVDDTGGELRGLCAFLGEDYDPRMTQPQRIAGTAVPPQKRWHHNTRTVVNSGRVGSWRARLEPWEIALAETVMGRRLREHGYPLTGVPRPPAAHLATYARVTADRRLVAGKRTLRDRWDRLREPNPVALVQRGELIREPLLRW